jgi:ATP-dependent DNA helicase RecG
LVYQELFILQLALSIRRHRIRTQNKAPEIEMTPKIRARILGRLPFKLTETQSQALSEIAADMNQAWPMNRLLHGEVGSGKTAVAVAAMLLAVAEGHQATLMAPTAVLANQHFATAAVGQHARAVCTVDRRSQRKSEERNGRAHRKWRG